MGDIFRLLLRAMLLLSLMSMAYLLTDLPLTHGPQAELRQGYIPCQLHTSQPTLHYSRLASQQVCLPLLTQRMLPETLRSLHQQTGPLLLLPSDPPLHLLPQTPLPPAQQEGLTTDSLSPR